MRVLVASTGGAGHFGPLVPFVEAFVRRGDEVLVVVPPALAARLEGERYAVAAGADPPAEEAAAIWERFPQVPPSEGAVLVNRELFGRLCTAAMLPAVEAACDGLRPDLVLREPCEFASAVAADRRGIPQAQVAISLAEIEASVLRLVAPVLEPYGDGIVDRILAAPYLTRFPGSLDPSPFAETRRFREVAKAGTLPDWWIGDEPLVYATFGSVAGTLPVAAAAYRAALDAVAGIPARVLLTIGRNVDAQSLGPLPANVHVEAWVPQADVLPHAAAVLCHGGSGTVFGALAAGVPLVVVPLFADQPSNGRLVAGAGAGLAVELDEGVAAIRAAVESVLGEAEYRTAAGLIAAEMGALPSVDEVLAA